MFNILVLIHPFFLITFLKCIYIDSKRNKIIIIKLLYVTKKK